MRLNQIEHKIALIANPCLDYPVESIDSEELPLEFIESNKLSMLLKEKGIETKTAKKEEEKLKYLMDEICELKNDFDDNGVDFVIIKFPELPRSHRDMDILIVNDIEGAEEVLKQRGYIFENVDDPYRKSCAKTVNGEPLSVDLHLDVSWWGIVYLEKEEIWRNKATRKINGVDIPVPSPEYEILITAANTVFGEIRINLFDVLYISYIVKNNNIDMGLIEATAKKNNWLKQYNYFIYLVNEVYKSLYDEKLFKALKSSSFIKTNHLPFRFPIYKIVSLKAQKIFSDLTHRGAREAIQDSWGYSLEILQLTIDFFRENMRIPTHPIFNMRRFLGGAAK